MIFFYKCVLLLMEEREIYRQKTSKCSNHVKIRYGTEIDQVSNLLQQLTKDKNKTKLSNLQKPTTLKHNYKISIKTVKIH